VFSELNRSTVKLVKDVKRTLGIQRSKASILHVLHDLHG
jgi:hypothetical protein